MVSIHDRLKRLEGQAASTAVEPLTEQQRKQLERWPEMVLERYVWGTLDDLAAMPCLPIQQMLQGLESDGYALQVDGQWHPLFLGEDAEINEQVIARIDTFDHERIGAAIEARRQTV